MKMRNIRPGTLTKRAAKKKRRAQNSTVVLLSAVDTPGRMAQVKKMLIAALIFVLSFAALIQFVVLQWRAGMVRVAIAMPEAACNLMKEKSFSDVVAFRKLCPDLGTDSAAPKLRLVRAYHSLLKGLSHITSGDWTKAEMELCARYASAVIMQHVKLTQAAAAKAGSF
ncbi:MAG TPA: hypothetical protein VNE63_20615 [Candidatus Acidoferrales bacterium]|nr:hypothetical protein [Candidatus Acidoferrales bacterium]